VPIIFRERTYGSSKMSKKIVWEATRRCVSLAFTPTRDAPAQTNATADPVGSIREGATDGR
jgi:hypothetical protein